jgi:hypothetical protein
MLPAGAAVCVYALYGHLSASVVLPCALCFVPCCQLVHDCDGLCCDRCAVLLMPKHSYCTSRAFCGQSISPGTCLRLGLRAGSRVGYRAVLVLAHRVVLLPTIICLKQIIIARDMLRGHDFVVGWVCRFANSMASRTVPRPTGQAVAMLGPLC